MKTAQQIIPWLASTAVLLLLGTVLSFWSFKQIGDAAEARKQAYVDISSAMDILSKLRDTETSQRGYLLTGDEMFLMPYRAARVTIRRDLDALRQRNLASTARTHLDTVAPLLDAKLTEMETVIQLHHDQGIAGALLGIRAGSGQNLMNAIRVEFASFVRIEETILAQHDAMFQSDMRRLLIIIVTASLFALLFAMAFGWLVYRQMQQRLKNIIHTKTQYLLEIQEETNEQLLQTNIILRDSEEKLSVTLNSIGDAVITTDIEARITRLNPVAELLTGWTQVEALGHPVSEVFNIINQETRQPAMIPVMETLALGTVQGLANHTILIAKSGSECAIADSCAPIRDRDDQVIGAVLVFRNVTQEYAAQQSLLDSAVLVQAVLNTAGDGIIILIARGGIIETVNPATERMFGYVATELVGKSFSQLIPELDRDQHMGALEYYSTNEEVRANGRAREVIGQRKDGSIFPLEMTVSEMWLGGQRYFTGILREITLRKQVEAERAMLNQILLDKSIELRNAKVVAEKANLAKSDFLSSMSHELRTPLSAILGFAQLIESGLPPPTAIQQRSLAQILKAGWYLLELINEILDLALVESGKLSLSLESISLSEVMNECEAMIGPQAQKYGIRVSFPILDAFYVIADRTRLKQVLINLLSNAIKYNKAGGTVAVSCDKNALDRIRICIKDTGEGLSAEKMALLFQPFNRLGREAGIEEGTGIGLVMTKRLIELMNGAIGLESIVGEGSTFWVEVNLSSETQASSLTVNTEGVSSQQDSAAALRYTLLYVEDNPANLMLIEDIVARRPGIQLLSAQDGLQGIEIACKFLPDVILMDINLPGISGIEALKKLKEIPATAPIPVVALSANAMPRDIEKGMQAGFFRYLTKPINVNEFLETLDVVLEYVQTKPVATPRKDA